MRIALYIEDGRQQIVLTPDGLYEKGVLELLHKGDRKLNIYKGGFYACMGGWTRESGNKDSTILVLDDPTKEKETSCE